MTQRTAILHIGTGKTGTTSIQRTLAGHRAELLEAGFAYPESPGERAHTRLAAYMQASAAADVGRMQRRAGPADAFERNLRAEVAAFPEHVRTVVFSCEHLYNRGTEPGVVATLRGLLDGLFADYRIVVYLRRQDEMAVSRLSTRLKAGRATTEPLPTDERSRMSLDYAAGLAPWAATFGAAALTVRIFARSELIEGDVVPDFLAVTGLPALPPPPAEANTSLRPEAQHFLHCLNDAAAPEAGDWRPPTHLRKFLTRVFGGRGVLPARAEAERFVEGFAAINESVRARHFPDRPTLFPMDFSRYPEEPTVVDEAAVVAVAAAVSRMQSAAIEELRTELAVDAAKAARASGRPAAAIPAYLDALAREPDSRRALRGLLVAIAAADDVPDADALLTGTSLPAPLRRRIGEAVAARRGEPAALAPPNGSGPTPREERRQLRQRRRAKAAPARPDAGNLES